MMLFFLLANLLIPNFILLMLGLSFSSSIGIILLWYVLPTLILSIVVIRHDRLSPHLRFLLTSVVAVLFWIGFDHRYTMPLFDVFNDLSYILNGFWIASLMMMGYGYTYGITYHQDENTDRGLVPTRTGLIAAQKGSLAASLIIIPAGILTGFLSWNPTWPGITDVIVGFIGIYLTIALQEELVFRGILLNEFDTFALPKNIDALIPLVVTSFAFGLTHWNNETPAYVPHYIILATIAGLAYGWAYRKSGLFGSMLTHTLIDWIWSLVLQRIQ